LEPNILLLLQQLLNGLALGSAYGMFAMSFGLIFATMGILNVAHGTIATFGAIAALVVVENQGFSFFTALLVAILVPAVIGIVVDRLAFQPLRARSNTLGYLITSIGVWIILINLAESALDHQIKTFPPDFIGYPKITGSIFLASGQVWLIIVGLLLVISLYLVLTRTLLGSQIRAVGYSDTWTRISGVNSTFVILATVVISTGIAGLAGYLSSIAFDNVSVPLGEGLLLKGFAAVVVGGFGDVRGAFLGGLVIGMTEILAAQYVSGNFRDVITFGLLIFFLLFKPEGIFGEVKFGAAR
jgi:branched-chain amino acid transport system permease protein